MARSKIVVSLLSAFLFGALALTAQASSSVSYGRKSVRIADSFQQPMQCILQKLQAQGYNARDVGCFGYRATNASAHPTGHACDVDQTGRNFTSLNSRFSYAAQISIAAQCEAVSGCKWRNADCGHFEQRSAPYSAAGTPIQGGGSYTYPQQYTYSQYADLHVTRAQPSIFEEILHMFGLA